MITKLLSLIVILIGIIFAALLISLAVGMIFCIISATIATIREISDKHKDDNKNT